MQEYSPKKLKRYLSKENRRPQTASLKLQQRGNSGGINDYNDHDDARSDASDRESGSVVRQSRPRK